MEINFICICAKDKKIKRIRFGCAENGNFPQYMLVHH